MQNEGGRWVTRTCTLFVDRTLTSMLDFEILLLERGRIKGEFSGIVFIDVLDRRRADIGLYRGTWQQKQKGD